MALGLGDSTWHRLHQEAKSRQIQVSSCPSVHGKVPPLHVRLVHYASNFTCTRPKHNWLMKGFYDIETASAIIRYVSRLPNPHTRSELQENLTHLRVGESKDPQHNQQSRVRSRGIVRFRPLLRRRKTFNPTGHKPRESISNSEVTTVFQAMTLHKGNDEDLRRMGTTKMNFFPRGLKNGSLH
jgi:hypothetical protein